MAATSRGVPPLVVFAVLSAAVDVYAGNRLQTVDPGSVAALSFTATAALFLGAEFARRGGEALSPSSAGLHKLGLLPSFAAMSVALEVGRRVEPTVDSASSPGYVYLVSDDPEQIAVDYRTLRELERTTLYGLSPPRR